MNIRLPESGALLLEYLKPQAARMLVLGLLLFGSIGLQLINPQVLRYFIDTSQAGGPERALILAGAIFLVVALAQRGASLGATYVGQIVGWRATNRLRAELALHCLRLDMGFHKGRTPGELIERIDGDVTALGNFFSQLVVRVLGNGILMVGILSLLFREDWRVGLGLTLYALLTLLTLRQVQNLAVSRWRAGRQAHAEQLGFLEERLTGMEDIRANGGEPYVMRRLYQLMRNLLYRERAAHLMQTLTFTITRFWTITGYVVGLALGVYLFLRGEATIGTVYLIIAYIALLARPLEEIRREVDDLQQAVASVGRVQELFAVDRAVQETPRAATLPPGPLGVEFQNVSFEYEAGEPVLQDVSFSLAPGKVLGLLGRTGSGKTTLTRLLFRLYDPSTGQIQLAGMDHRDLTLAGLRARVGMVTQDVQLFQASVRDNLTFFNRQITDEKILSVVEVLGLRPWLDRLPAGLDTPLVGAQGLSAGEAQLLAFTRVFLREPGLVILDEASSRLDPATEQLLEQAIGRLLADRTGIVIAHRLETVLRADEIMILEQGRIVEYGPRERLAADPASRFARLLRAGLEEVLE
jgi:ATP-binding cassette, subfamily B, bacterial